MAIGIAAALMTLSEMNREYKAIWILIIFVLAVLENQSIDTDRTKAEGIQDKLVADSNELTRNTKELVLQVSLLTPQIVTANTNLASALSQLHDAQQRNDAALITKFQGKVDEARAEAAAASKRLAVTLVPELAKQFRFEADESRNRWRAIAAHFDAPLSDMSRSAQWPEIRKQANLEEDNEQRVYQSRIRDLVVTADYLRRQLVQDLPPTQEDEAEKQSFAKVINGDIKGFDPNRAVQYLQDLVARNHLSN
jgi:hypothetical protein